jgi:hypothetical protein
MGGAITPLVCLHGGDRGDLVYEGQFDGAIMIKLPYHRQQGYIEYCDLDMHSTENGRKCNS